MRTATGRVTALALTLAMGCATRARGAKPRARVRALAVDGDRRLNDLGEARGSGDEEEDVAEQFLAGEEDEQVEPEQAHGNAASGARND